MKIVLKILEIISKTVACIIVLAILAVAATSFSPVYRFRAPAPFCGPDIYNPYSQLDSTNCWKRANFHTHTRVEGPLNECEYWPAEVYAALEKLGYDIVTFSNHNELTQHPFDSTLHVSVYEHGYNLLKYHKLVFGTESVMHFDHILPIFAFQKQFQINRLTKDAELIQVNHPLRTPTLSDTQLENLSGYRLIELDSGRSTENRYWDMALSAGHYSYGVANDDLHYPDRSSRIGVRCNFLCCESARWEDIRECFKSGCFYSMRVPDYGHGDWETKYEKNRDLPSVRSIGLNGSTIFISLSEPADSIKVIGQSHATLKTSYQDTSLEYTMAAGDSYARIIAYFPEGEVIYTNPFARYDATLSENPFNEAPLRVNIFMTLLFNLGLLIVCIGCAYAIYLIFKKRK